MSHRFFPCCIVAVERNAAAIQLARRYISWCRSDASWRTRFARGRWRQRVRNVCRFAIAHPSCAPLKAGLDWGCYASPWIAPTVAMADY